MLLLDHINKNQKQKPKKNRLWIRPQKDLTLLGAQKKTDFHAHLFRKFTAESRPELEKLSPLIPIFNDPNCFWKSN